MLGSENVLVRLVLLRFVLSRSQVVLVRSSRQNRNLPLGLVFRDIMTKKHHSVLLEKAEIVIFVMENKPNG